MKRKQLDSSDLGGNDQLRSKPHRMAIVGKLRSLLCFILFVYILPPVIFRYSPLVQRSLLFMNYANTQNGVNLSHPEQAGIKCSRTLQLEHPNEIYDLANGQEIKLIKLGVWHILPESSLISCVSNKHNNRTFIEDRHAFSSDTRPIVLYLHGNGGNRAGNYRSRLYRRLAYELDFHVVTFDYRGYGDSTDESPTTFGLTSDARFVYNWLLSQPGVALERVSVWGHSLGTAVAIRMVASIDHEQQQPNRLILEAPFDSIANALASHPWTALHRNMPYFHQFIVDPIEGSPELNFDSLKHIEDIKSSSIIIVHAQDDPIVAHKLGENLYEHAQKALGEVKVTFISIPENYKLGHTNIGTHNETLLQVKKFIETGIVYN